MANNDPVSGLYASLSRVRRRGPEGGFATQAGTAAQAGTVQPAPPTLRPVALPSMPQPQAQAQPVQNPLMALQAAQPAPEPQAIALPQNAPQTPSEAPVSPDDIEVIRLANLFREAVPEFPEEVALALAAQYLEENTAAVPTQPGQTLV
jgi:hypothetical protein